jgi:hypothetical protein
MFECRVSYFDWVDDAQKKQVQNLIIEDVDTFTGAESVAAGVMGQLGVGDYTVDIVKRSRIREVIFKENDAMSDDTILFEVGVKFVTVDEESGRVKKKAVKLLVEGSDNEDALKVLDAAVTTDYEFVSLKETSFEYWNFDTALKVNESSDDESSED